MALNPNQMLEVPRGSSPGGRRSPSRPYSPGGGRQARLDDNILNLITYEPGQQRYSNQSPYNNVAGRVSRSGLSRGQISRQNFIRDAQGGLLHDANEAIEMNSPDNIERERKYEMMLIQLKKQFNEIDENGDGFVEKGELINYLIHLTRAKQLSDPS